MLSYFREAHGAWLAVHYDDSSRESLAQDKYAKWDEGLASLASAVASSWHIWLLCLGIISTAYRMLSSSTVKGTLRSPQHGTISSHMRRGRVPHKRDEPATVHATPVNSARQRCPSIVLRVPDIVPHASHTSDRPRVDIMGKWKKAAGDWRDTAGHSLGGSAGSAGPAAPLDADAMRAARLKALESRGL